MTDSDPPVFDPDHLAEASADDLAFQREVVGDFLGRLDGLLGEVAQALARRDPTAVRLAAHTLKGASASLGARALAEAGAGLESFGRAGDLERAATALDQARLAAERLREALEGFLRDRAA